MQLHFFIVLVILGFSATLAKYEIPAVEFKLLNDGFRVSIPNKPGVKYVAFNVNRNRPFKSFEAGEFSTQVREPSNNHWVYEIKRMLEDDDILYVWTNVQHEKSVYRSIAAPIYVNAEKNINRNDDANIKEKNKQDDVNVACAPSITMVRNRNICKGELIFEDNFDAELNESIWKQEVRLPLDVGDSEFVMYDTNAEVDNGLLKIKPILWNEDRPGTDIRHGQLDLGTRCTGIQNRAMECERHSQGQVYNVLPPVVSARINTKNSFSFKYGRIEIRAKLPKGDWLFPLLLLEPLAYQYGQNAYSSGQMRIAFARGNLNLSTQNGVRIDGCTLYGGAVLTPESAFRDKSMVNVRQNNHYGNEFHVYTLIWDNRKLTLKIDGQEYGHVDGGFSSVYSDDSTRSNAWKAGGYMAPFDEEFFITLGVSVGGHGDFPDENLSKPWLNTSPKATLMFWRDRNNWKQTWNDPELLVDYVRVYAI